MPYNSKKLMQLVSKQTKKNLRTLLAEQKYSMMGECVGKQKGFVCHILHNSRSYLLLARIGGSIRPQDSLQIELYLPVWIPPQKREEMRAFLRSFCADYTEDRPEASGCCLDMGKDGLVSASRLLDMDDYRDMLEALLNSMPGVQPAARVEMLAQYCAPGVETLGKIVSALQSLLFRCEERIVPMMYPGVSVDGGGGQGGDRGPIPDAVSDVLAQLAAAGVVYPGDVPVQDVLMESLAGLLEASNEDGLKRIASLLCPGVSIDSEGLALREAVDRAFDRLRFKSGKEELERIESRMHDGESIVLRAHDSKSRLLKKFSVARSDRTSSLWAAVSEAVIWFVANLDADALRQLWFKSIMRHGECDAIYGSLVQNTQVRLVEKLDGKALGHIWLRLMEGSQTQAVGWPSQHEVLEGYLRSLSEGGEEESAAASAEGEQ